MPRGGRSGYSSEEENEFFDLHVSLTSSCETDNSNLLSASTSPMSLAEASVKKLTASFEDLLSAGRQAHHSGKMGLSTEELKKFVRSRSAYKGQITRTINDIDRAKTEGSLDRIAFKFFYDELKGKLDKYHIADSSIQDLYDANEVDESDVGRKKDLDDSHEYLASIRNKMVDYEKYLVSLEQKTASSNVNSSNDELVKAITKAQGTPGRQMITCERFDGCNDKLDFKFWLSQFETMINAGRPMEGRYKLSCLRNHLTKGGLAFKLIGNLELNDSNYVVAIEMLKEEFLNEEKIVNQLFSQILVKIPKIDSDFQGLRMYIAEIKALLNDLKISHKIDLISPGTGGYKFVSSIIFSKITPVIQKALIAESKSNYPTLDHIFNNIKNVIETSVITNKSKPKTEQRDWKPSGEQRSNAGDNAKGGATLENFHTKIDQSRSYHCRFCDVDGHSSYYCNQFKTLEQRKNRCTELKLCYKCTSNKHIASFCPGQKGELYTPCRTCNSKGHIGAMCMKDVSLNSTVSKTSPKGAGITDACFTTGIKESTLLLPIINLRLRGHDGQSHNFNFLYDTASQRSYLDHQAFDKLGCNSELVSNLEFEVKTFLGSSKKQLREVNLDVYTGQYKHYAMLMLIDDQFDINFNVKGLGQAVSNLRDKGFKLAADYNDGDLVKVHGLIGVDIIQYLKQNQMINCINGSALKLPQGIIPFGNVNNFLYPDQLNLTSVEPAKSVSNTNFVNIVGKYTCPSTFVNFVLEPKHSYDDPFESFFDESLVERRIDKMISCDSLGIDENSESLSDYDADRIKKFRDSIELIDGEYHVELVFHDNIDQVQSNAGVSLNVADRVYKDLTSKGKYDEYLDQFKTFESEKIIERIEVDPKDFHKYIWIPHRPVFKTDEQSTTKMRPVFNASLKTKKGTPSLNEASYCGINLMKDMNELLMLFRTNHYVYLSDIRKAFLMIKLKKIKDRNRFCFFVREGDKLICYRFATIIFGFNASPFILNYVLQYHASLFSDDECSEMLKNNFFVDNLVKSHNSEEKLKYLYETSIDRMGQGGFDLRSCNTNSEKLKQKMINDGKFVEHGCEYEKVLGYMYSPVKDVLRLAKSNINLMLILLTKRIILSQYAKVFDPLGLTAPVTVRGKTLLSSLWQKKSSDDHWDVKVGEEDSKAWNNLSNDLVGLSNIEFPRYSLSEDELTDLYLFCDASKKAYGYVAYAVQNGKSGFILSKPKVAPMQTKSLPTLELLSVFLAFKGLYSILKTFKKVKVKNIFIGVDAQVVLSWLLSDVVKTKNQFARNRIRDVHRMFKELTELYNVPIFFKYVPTKENPADMLTRGMSLVCFKENLNFWLEGPSWIQSKNVVWPTNDLGCLSDKNKNLVLCTGLANAKPIEPIVPFAKFSKINKLIGTTAVVISVLNKYKLLKDDVLISLWGTIDPRLCAKVHLFRVMQKQRFFDEIAYLKDPKGKAPVLVSDLDLFFDGYGILRSAGRAANVLEFEYDVINPILLAKDHNLTSLIIEDCHERCQHLGIGATLNKVRLAGFWIPKGRQAVKNVISLCFMCKRFNSLAFKYPKVTNLPKHRVNLIKPFRHTGIDYTGVIQLREKKGDKCKEMYLLIFTCLCIRAVHIELVPDMNTKSLVLAIIRFTNIYGIPSHIYSDNAKTFIAGCDLMKEVFKASEFSERFSKYNIKHIRIPAYSAWVGSTWERMIRVIKSCLYKVVGRSAIGYFKLLTVLSDIQNAINSRPLTYRCADDSSLDIITPNCFLKPLVDDSLLFKSEEENLLTANPPCRKAVVRTLNSRENILEKFRQLWYEEYLLSLREQCKDLHEVNFENRIKIDEVVLVKGPPSKKRPWWRLGRVLELVPGYDGKVRSVKLRRADGEIAHHSLNHLYPMELSLTHSYTATQPNGPSDLVNLADPVDGVAKSSCELPGAAELHSTVEADIALEIANSMGPDDSNQVLDVSFEGFRADQLEVTTPGSNLGLEVVNSQTLDDSVGDQVLDHNLNMVAPSDAQVAEVVRDNADNVVLSSRRSRRVKPSRRPLDQEFEFY